MAVNVPEEWVMVVLNTTFKISVIMHILKQCDHFCFNF